jgi:hypothetical protein
MQSDKILLSVYVTFIVGFITAVLSIVRLVNDKEGKTTDYRKSWTDSVRKSFAELISNINLLASTIAHRKKDFTGEQDSLAQEHELRRVVCQSYALTRLHFKPNDLSFARIEQKFDVVLEFLEKLGDIENADAKDQSAALREKIFAASADITAYSRDILKTEWESVKRGEPAYQQTKLWSFVGGAIAMMVLFVFGVVTVWQLLRIKPEPVSVATAVPASQSAASTAAQPGAVSDRDATSNFAGCTNSQTVTVYSGQSASPPTRIIPPPSVTTSRTCK